MSEEGVTFSFKDLFDKLDKQLTDGFDKLDKRMDTIDRRLELKADNTRVAELEKRMGDHEVRVDKRFTPLEASMVGAAAVTNFQRWVVGTVGVGVVSAIATLVWLASGGH